jgi:CheY-like chemotaxis protein
MAFYRLSPAPESKVTLVLAADGANGIALSPDGALLYLGTTESGGGPVRRLALKPDGSPDGQPSSWKEASSDGKERGATFTVRLPVAPLRADALAERAPAAGRLVDPPLLECPEALKGLRVLVVDDEPETRALLKFVIEQCAALVTVEPSAADGLRALEQTQFDLLISDVGMPGEDGYSFVRKVRQLPAESTRRIPALALTAYARVEDRTAALRAGFNMHLTKPIDPSELLVVLETLVRGMAR